MKLKNLRKVMIIRRYKPKRWQHKYLTEAYQTCQICIIAMVPLPPLPVTLIQHLKHLMAEGLKNK